MSNKSGQFEIYTDSFPEPGHEVRISSGGGLYPEWSDAGDELFYVSPDNTLSVRPPRTDCYILGTVRAACVVSIARSGKHVESLPSGPWRETFPRSCRTGATDGTTAHGDHQLASIAKRKQRSLG